jgi:hypothetical protein
MRKLIGILGLMMAMLLSACGGGGGSAGDTQERYSITLRADKTSLPTNISMLPVGYVGASAPYTTTLYVNAKEGDDAIPPGKDIFSCKLEGLPSGVLYYLDGSTDHEDKDGNPLAFRSVILPANAGGSSFHFHAWTEAGTAHITCSVVDPRDNRVYSASVDIAVGAVTGKPSSIQVISEAPNYLGAQGNLSNLRSSIVIQSSIWDDANQPVPNPTAPNLQVSIKSVGGASLGARLQSGSASGVSIQVRTIGGVASFTLSSGPNTGLILLELTADRYDNDVSNGIKDPVTQYIAIPVVNVWGPLQFPPLNPNGTPNTDAMTFKGASGQAFAGALDAEGGALPYTWAGLDALPSGLSLNSQSGIISGVINSTEGTYKFRVMVTDALGNKATAVVTITVAAPSS